jgi:hypothetical protein
LEQARKSFGGWRRKSKAVSRWRNGRPEKVQASLKRHKSAGAPRAPRPCEAKCKSECSFQLALHFLPAHTSRCTTATAHGLPPATPCAHLADHCTRRIRPQSTPRPHRVAPVASSDSARTLRPEASSLHHDAPTSQAEQTDSRSHPRQSGRQLTHFPAWAHHERASASEEEQVNNSA